MSLQGKKVKTQTKGPSVGVNMTKAEKKAKLRALLKKCKHDPEEDAKLKELTWEEINKHNKEDDMWVVICGRVYDVTPWVDGHPGGKDVFTEHSGQDSAEEWWAIDHTAGGRVQAHDYLIGRVKGEKLGDLFQGLEGRPQSGPTQKDIELMEAAMGPCGGWLYYFLAVLLFAGFGYYNLLLNPQWRDRPAEWHANIVWKVNWVANFLDGWGYHNSATWLRELDMYEQMSAFAKERYEVIYANATYWYSNATSLKTEI